MKKNKVILLSLLGFTGLSAYSQDALTAFNLSQPDLKGTARFMGMAGAFGALGGDLSSLSQNPAGIGVYRSSDIGFTLDLDVQNSSTNFDGKVSRMDQTKFLLNNIGAVLTMRLPSKACPNLNFGFTYNKGVSFNRVYGGTINTLKNSMSNFMAGIANAYELTEGDVSFADGYDPYNAPYDYVQAPWLTVLGYNSRLINPVYNPDTEVTDWYGLWDNNSMTGNNTTGMGQFMMQERGSVNDFNIALGGNINNILYWGMNFDITSLNYSINAIWEEKLSNAAIMDDSGVFSRGNANWNLNSLYSISGTGFNYQLGFILKPVQQFRLGFAFHTPTWYTLNEDFSGLVNYKIGDYSGTELTNDGIPGYTSYNFRTPWKIIASAAGVLGNNLIVSFDYEWANYGKMHYSEPTYYNDGYYWDYPWDWYSMQSGPVALSNFPNLNDPYAGENGDIATYYKSSNTFRVGVEFKPISSLSIRAGYSYVSSPVRKEAKDNREVIYTSSLMPSYRFDNSTNYVTCGLGYRYSHFYVDLAYVYKNMGAEYHAFTPDIGPNAIPSPQSKVSLTDNQIVLSMGYRF